MRCFKMVIVLAVLMIGTVSSRAQAGGVQGTLVDGRNLSIIGATVVVKDSSGVPKGGCVSNADGFYQISPLAVGHYTLDVDYLGHTTSKPVDVMPNIITETAMMTIVTPKILPIIIFCCWRPRLMDTKAPGSIYSTNSTQLKHMW